MSVLNSLKTASDYQLKLAVEEIERLNKIVSELKAENRKLKDQIDEMNGVDILEDRRYF